MELQRKEKGDANSQENKELQEQAGNSKIQEDPKGKGTCYLCDDFTPTPKLRRFTRI